MSYRVGIFKAWAIPEVAEKYGKTVKELEQLWADSEEKGIVCTFLMEGEPPSDRDRVAKASERSRRQSR